MNYNALSGPQLTVLRAAILDAFGYDMNALALVVQNQAGLRPLGYYASDNLDADTRLGFAIDKMQRQYVLHLLVEAVRGSDYARNPGLLQLDDRLSLADPDPLDETDSPQDVFQRAMSGFADAEVFLWSQTLLQLAAAMAQISFPLGQKTSHGTGIALRDGTILTNSHVVDPLAKGSAGLKTVAITFNLALGRPDGAPIKTIGLRASDWLGLNRPPSDADLTVDEIAAPEELDYAIIVPDDGAPADHALSLSDAAPPPRDGAVLLILHHPAGQPLKLSLGRSLGLHGSNRLRYKARTVGGSSGGLVLDAKLRPVALHHAGDPVQTREATYNQGIPLMSIAADIAKRRDA